MSDKRFDEEPLSVDTCAMVSMTDILYYIIVLKKRAIDRVIDDDLPIGVLYDGEMAYSDLHYVFLGDDGLVRLVGD